MCIERHIRENGKASFGQTGQASSRSKASVNDSSRVSSSVSSSSSVAPTLDVSFAAELATWVGKSEQNIQTMQEFVDFYSKSSSHTAVVAKVNSYMFEYRGLSSKMEIYADIAKTTPLTTAQRDEINKDKTRMNELVDLFNEIFGPQSGQ